MRNEGEDGGDYMDNLNGTPIFYKYSARKYRELNAVYATDSRSSPSGVYWDASSPPQRVRGMNIEAESQSSQSQSQGRLPESSPLSLLQVRHKRIPQNKIIPRSKPKSQFQRQKSMDEIKNGGVTVIPKTLRPRKTKASKSETKKNVETTTSSSENSAENTTQTYQPPAYVPSDSDFPEDNFDDDIFLASQQVEQKLNNNLPETPKCVPKTGRKSVRKLHSEAKKQTDVSMNASLFESSTLDLELTSNPINQQTGRSDPLDDEFGDEDDDLFSQIDC